MPIVYRFLDITRCWWKIVIFFIRVLCRAPWSSSVRKPSIKGLVSVTVWRYVKPLIQTDRWTDSHLTTAKTALCIALRGKSCKYYLAYLLIYCIVSELFRDVDKITIFHIPLFSVSRWWWSRWNFAMPFSVRKLEWWKVWRYAKPLHQSKRQTLSQADGRMGGRYQARCHSIRPAA